MPIRTDCYLAVLKQFREKHPDAHFEVITRTAGSTLSPSWEMLKRAKREKWDFKRYRTAFLAEMLHPENKVACVDKLLTLKHISEERDVFLVCYEKDPSQCHRSIVKEMLEAVP